MKRIWFAILRFLNGMSRPRSRENLKLLKERGEDLGSIVIREANRDDIPALAELHARTWSDTYPNVRNPPTAAIRESQWEKAFEEKDGSWFCLVVENSKGQLVGFAKGVKKTNAQYPAELSKLYLLGLYQRMGLGRKLMKLAATRFLDEGMASMSCYVDPANPSCAFFEALDGAWLIEPDGEINYCWYVWKDLKHLVAVCSE